MLISKQHIFSLEMFNFVVKYEELHFARRIYGHYIFEMFRQYRIIVSGPAAVRFVWYFTFLEKATDGVRLLFPLEKADDVVPNIGNDSVCKVFFDHF